MSETLPLNPCMRHSKYAPHAAANREPLDHIIEKLARSQAGKGVHRCAYCAYEQGYKDALSDVEQALASLHPPYAEPEKSVAELTEEIGMEED